MYLYRRHLRSCRHRKKKRSFTGCKCPIWVDGVLNGRRHHKTLKTTVWEKALNKLAGLESVGEDPKSRTIADALAAWESSFRIQALRESTIRKYRRLEHMFSAWCDDKGYVGLNQITTEVIDAFRTDRPKLQASTSAKELEILRAIFSFCMDRGWCHDNPAQRIKTPKVRPKEKVPYTPQEMIAILSACDLIGQEVYERQRARAMILVMRHTGLRVGDSFLLRKDHVRDGRVFLHAKKNGQPIFLPVPKELQSALESLPLPFGSDRDSGYFFWNGKGDPASALTRVEKALHSVYQKSGVRGAHSHRFRHTVATEALARGASLSTVADILGISIHVAEKHYIKWSPQRQERVWEIMSELQKPQPETEKPVTPLLRGESQLVN